MDEQQVKAGKRAWQAKTVYTGEQTPRRLPLRPETPYKLSCLGYHHNPPCQTFHDHLVKCYGDPDRRADWAVVEPLLRGESIGCRERDA